MSATTPIHPAVDVQELASRVRAKRDAQNLSLRVAAKKLGMSAATLSRAENGTHIPEGENLVKLARWVGMPLDRPRRRARTDVHGPGASTMEAIELHLRADKELTVDDAEMLVDLMRTAYQRLSRRKPG